MTQIIVRCILLSASAVVRHKLKYKYLRKITYKYEEHHPLINYSLNVSFIHYKILKDLIRARLIKMSFSLLHFILLSSNNNIAITYYTV